MDMRRSLTAFCFSISLCLAGVRLAAHVVFPRKEQREAFRQPEFWSAHRHLHQETPEGLIQLKYKYI